MKILFVSPRLSEFDVHKFYFHSINRFFWKVVSTPTLNFRMLAAVTPEEHLIRLVDEEFQKVDFNEKCDMVGITVTTPAATRAYEIADEFRSRGKAVVLGGWHPSALPQEAKQHADSVIIGEGEESWPQLLKDFERGKLKPFYEQKKPVDLKTIPPPARRRMLNKGGFIMDEIQATRGCFMGCKYCTITNSVHRRIFRFRPIDDVIEEIRSIPQKILYFADPSLTLNPQYSKQLFKAMKRLNKKFSCNGNISILHRDDELLKLSKDAGCVEWSIGFESISQKSLNLIGKKTNKVKEFASTIDKIHDHGMGVKGNFMFGFDEEYPNIFERTVDTICEWGIDLPCFSILTPFPGTPLFDSLEKEKRILTKEWSKFDARHVVFQPKHMSSQELFEGIRWVYKQFYSTYNTTKRTLKCLKFSPYSFLTTGLENFYIRSLFNE